QPRQCGIAANGKRKHGNSRGRRLDPVARTFCKPTLLPRSISSPPSPATRDPRPATLTPRPATRDLLPQPPRLLTRLQIQLRREPPGKNIQSAQRGGAVAGCVEKRHQAAEGRLV